MLIIKPFEINPCSDSAKNKYKEYPVKYDSEPGFFIHELFGKDESNVTIQIFSSVRSGRYMSKYQAHSVGKPHSWIDRPGTR